MSKERLQRIRNYIICFRLRCRIAKKFISIRVRGKNACNDEKCQTCRHYDPNDGCRFPKMSTTRLLADTLKLDVFKYSSWGEGIP